MLPIIGAAYVLVGAAYEVIGAAVVTGAETEACTGAVMEPVVTWAALTCQWSDRREPLEPLASLRKALQRRYLRHQLDKDAEFNSASHYFTKHHF